MKQNEGWIDKKISVPVLGVPVLLGNPNWPRPVIGRRVPGEDEWNGFLDMTEELPVGDPTHWQPLPKLPQDPQ